MSVPGIILDLGRVTFAGANGQGKTIEMILYEYSLNMYCQAVLKHTIHTPRLRSIINIIIYPLHQQRTAITSTLLNNCNCLLCTGRIIIGVLLSFVFVLVDPELIVCPEPTVVLGSVLNPDISGDAISSSLFAVVVASLFPISILSVREVYIVKTVSVVASPVLYFLLKVTISYKELKPPATRKTSLLPPWLVSKPQVLREVQQLSVTTTPPVNETSMASVLVKVLIGLILSQRRLKLEVPCPVPQQIVRQIHFQTDPISVTYEPQSSMLCPPQEVVLRQLPISRSSVSPNFQ